MMENRKLTKPLSQSEIACETNKLDQMSAITADNGSLRPDIAALISAANTVAALLRDVTDLVIATSGWDRNLSVDKKARAAPSSREIAPEPIALSPQEIEETLTDDYIVCLEDGRRVKSLKPYLRRFSLTPDQYRRKWKLPIDYPMVCRNLSEKRSALVRKTKPHLKRYPNEKAAAE